MSTGRIIVIEPHQPERLLYEWELRDQGYEVAAYANAKDLSRAGSLSMPSLVLLDGGDQMPMVMDRVRNVRRSFPVAAIVVYTASRTLASQCPSGLADAVLLKSADLTGLMQTIGSLVNSRQ